MKWWDTTIGELADRGLVFIQTGPFGSQLHAHDYGAAGVHVVPTEAIRDRRIDKSVCPLISEAKAAELSRHRLESGDILFARRGVQATGHIGVVRPAEAGFICGTGAIRLRVLGDNNVVDAEYLSHLLADPASVAWFKFHAIGATMPNLNEGIIKSFPLRLPNLRYQRRTAAFLSALDDKIELNRRVNEKLEAMAQAIFRDWFVDFGPVRRKLDGERDPVAIMGGLTHDAPQATELAALFPDALSEEGRPSGWAEGRLGEFVASMNERRKVDNLTASKPYVPIDCLPARSLALADFRPGEEAQSSLIGFRENDILFGAMRPYFHKVVIAPFEGTTRTTVFVLRPRDQSDLAFCALLASSPSTIEFATANSSGTTIPYAVWANSMENMRTVGPPAAVRSAFGGLVEPMLSKLKASLFENRSLAETRDYLLPRLMSGKVRVSEPAAEAAA